MRADAFTFHRLSRRLVSWHLSGLARICDALAYFLFAATVPATAEIGTGTRCGHRGTGIVLGRQVKIGQDCLIRQQVVIGGKGRGTPGQPVLGDNVEIGAGAKILGAIKLGRNCVVGANAVVIKDVPAGAVVAGVPARIIGWVEGFSPDEDTAA